MASSSSSLMPANGDGDYSVLTIASLEETVNGTKWLLDPSAGKKSCCIFRVPQCIVEINQKTFGPHIVSIGPYHHGQHHLEMMQQHKRRFLRDLLAQTPQSTGPGLDDYRQAVAAMEQDIRGCYSESTLTFCRDELVDMMVLDGLFIVELFCKIARLSKTPISHDPIFHFASVFRDIIRDLLRLENQIPFFVLQTLFDTSRASRNNSNSSIAQLALQFFRYAVEIPHEAVQGKHLLDLLRLSFIHPSMRHKQNNGNTSSSEVQFIQSAKQLHLAGIKFKARHAHKQAMSFLDLRFSKGVLEIPHITLDDLRTDLFRNFVAFEERYSHSPRHITTYAVFMSCLVRTPMDATFLRDHNIIENYLATDKEVANFFRNMGKDVPFDIDECYLLKLFNDINEYQRTVWHVQWAGFKFKYFDTPWSFLSASAAVILLLFTAIQTFFAVWAYKHPPLSS